MTPVTMTTMTEQTATDDQTATEEMQLVTGTETTGMMETVDDNPPGSTYTHTVIVIRE